MGFIKYMYVGPKNVLLLHTTNNAVDQLWQQLVQLRHVSRLAPTYGAPMNSYLVDQAKTYFLDAAASNWRSSGLLYYYSYLNLAKALLHSKGTFPDATIRSSSLLHGLSANPQEPNEIINFRLKIWPKVANGKSNVFPFLYEAVTSSAWPFADGIVIEVGEVLSYCEQIAAELLDFYSMRQAMTLSQSLLRFSVDNSQAWYEFLVPGDRAASIASELGPPAFAVAAPAQYTPLDRQEWFDAYDKTNAVLNEMALVRSPSVAITPGVSTFDVLRTFGDVLHRFALPSPTYHQEQQWNFVPRITLGGQRMYWHPLLSDYLFSFVLSTILRYYPHLLTYNQRDSFLAQAWCKQSAQIALRYFLMEFTDPVVVLRQV